MSASFADVWPWLALAGLGAYHGLNPAMGWLFAVALGLHRGSRRIVLLSLAPLAVGHAAAVATVLVAVVASGTVLDARILSRAAGAVLIAWAAWHVVAGHRRRVRVGMQTGLAGLALWSFLMAGSHGAGLMLVPAVVSLCSPGGASGEFMTSGPFGVAFLALGIHTGAMLVTVAATAVVVYEWAGIDFLRRGWINLDLLWSIALAGSGVILLAI
ncbi:MAG TPA: hypothetical protein VHG30_15095 [Microvirga sp.]|nr:hypothetical protein [Microvirga sp.]